MYSPVLYPNNAQIELFSRLSPVLGVNPRVTSYADDFGVCSLDILHCTDAMDAGVSFYGTLGLMGHDLKGGCYEIVMGGYERFPQIEAIVASCAFFVMRDKWNCSLGNVFESVISMYYPEAPMKHVMFYYPYLWHNRLASLQVLGTPIKVMLGIPISQSELEYKRRHGLSALEDLFDRAGIDIFDINRKPVVK